MDMSGEYVIPAPRETVWKALNDPEILRRCIPGCEEMEKTSDTSFAAKVTAKVGPVKARFSGAVTLSDIDPPSSYRITGEGTGGAAGFAKGSAVVRLEETSEGTKLTYTVDANVGGKLAQVGSRLIDATAKKMANEFFGRFAEIVAPPETVSEAAGAESTEEDKTKKEEQEAPLHTPKPEGEGPSRGIPAVVWVAGLIVLAAILLYLLGSGGS